jgi:hypothetical protein
VYPPGDWILVEMIRRSLGGSRELALYGIAHKVLRLDLQRGGAYSDTARAT